MPIFYYSSFIWSRNTLKAFNNTTLYYRPTSGAQSCITVKHQILNHENHDPRNSRHHLIRGIFRSRREKNAPFTCNLICKTTLKSTQQIHGNISISTIWKMPVLKCAANMMFYSIPTGNYPSSLDNRTTNLEVGGTYLI